MIASMTAFARIELSTAQGNAIWEIRSINHRYLELNFRLPELFTLLEPDLREILKKYLQRGKIDILLRWQTVNNYTDNFTLNKPLITQLIQSHAELIQLVGDHTALKTTALNPMEILRWPGVLQMRELNITNIRSQLLQRYEQALVELVAARKREGHLLNEILLQKLAICEVIIKNITEKIAKIILQQREKIVGRLAETKINLDPNRLEQELVLLAQKMDITEEIDRLQGHIIAVKHTLAKNDAIGRNLDFLMQELHREANTLGAKSTSLETSQAAVELKIAIEQMREQVQNIE